MVSRVLRLAFVFALAAVVVSAVASTATVDEPVAQEAGAGRQATPQQADAYPQTMFGFVVGEQRRYTLGPPDVLVDGERFEWRIALADVTMSEGRLFAVFDLGFESRSYSGVDISTLYARSLRARVIVNEDGFPGLLTVEEQMNDAVVTTRYVLQEDATYTMTIKWPENEYAFDIPLASHGNLDFDTQRGLYLFTNGLDLRGELRFNVMDSIFANPGLLSLVLPWPPREDGWEGEFLGFTPAPAMVRYPSGTLLRQLQNRGVAREQSFTRLRLRLRAPEEVEIGGRTVEAFKLEVRGPFRNAWVDRLGRVLLLEHDGHHRGRPRHVRMLWPSEY